MADEKKFLDQAGVQYLWSQLSLHDYPNNETLVAVINAIDETKADKIHIHDIATIEKDGFMSAADKSKLDGIDPSLYAKSIGLAVTGEDAMITWDSQVLPVKGVEF